jgi:hypothetical protein
MTVWNFELLLRWTWLALYLKARVSLWAIKFLTLDIFIIKNIFLLGRKVNKKSNERGERNLYKKQKTANFSDYA